MLSPFYPVIIASAYIINKEPLEKKILYSKFH